MLNQKFKFSLLFILVLSIQLFSQTQEIDSICTNNNSVNHIFDIQFINGYSLGYNIYSKSNNEIRIMLDLRISQEFENGDEELLNSNNGSPTTERRTSEYDYGFYIVNLSAHYMTNLYSSKLGEAFLGFGPILGLSWQDNSSELKRSNALDKSNYSDNEYSVGIVAIAGIRSYLTKSISIFAEGHLSGGKTWRDSENKSIYNTESYHDIYGTKSEKNGWYYNLVYAKVGLRFSI